MTLLAACLSVLFAMDGPVCPAERQSLSCECSECMTWDVSPEASRYELERETVSTGARYLIGTLTPRLWLDDDGGLHSDLPTLWCTAWDAPFPRDGTLYRYRARACNAGGCSGWSSPAEYRGAPYACWDGGREVACYVGDSVVTR